MTALSRTEVDVGMFDMVVVLVQMRVGVSDMVPVRVVLWCVLSSMLGRSENGESLDDGLDEELRQKS